MPAVPSAERDLRLDFFRGLALFFIFIDHIPDNFLSHYTVHSISFSNAAEIFIFISGFTAALVYGRILGRRGPVMAIAHIYRRVWHLYIAHVFLFVIFVAEVSFSSMRLHNPIYSNEMRLDEFLAMPHVAIAQALILRFQPTFLDILPLYIVLLAVFPIVLLLIAYNRWLALIPALALYVATQLFSLSVPGFPEGHVWFFNPLAWQLLFVIGAVFGYAVVSGETVLPSGRWPGVLAAVIAAAAALINLSWLAHSYYPAVPDLLGPKLWPLVTDKTNLAPLRLINFLALAAVAARWVPADSRFLTARVSHALSLCGRHSLEVFCLGILLSVMAHIVLTELHDGLLMQLAVSAIGITVMLGTGLLLEWYKETDRPMPSRAAPQPNLRVVAGSASVDPAPAATSARSHA